VPGWKDALHISDECHIVDVKLRLVMLKLSLILRAERRLNLMSVRHMIGQENHEVMETGYFVEQLMNKWSGIRIVFLHEPTGYILQFEVSAEFWVLGDFFGTGVWYQASSNEDTARFALWYRSIVPAEWKLDFYDSGLYFDRMFITNETTEAEIIAGFDIPFDISKYE
jgi:hypothetical protein